MRVDGSTSVEKQHSITLLLKTNIWDLLPSVLFLKATNQNSCFHYIRPFISEDESKCIKMRLCSINFGRLLHWFITLWFINPLKVTLMPKQRYPHQLWGMWSSMWLMKINAKSHLVIENDSNSSVANLSRVADSTDIADLIRRHISEAKSISKQPANTPLWIKARADLQIPITSLALTAKYTTRGRQTGRRTGGQTKRMEKQERSGLKHQKNLGESKCTREKKKRVKTPTEKKRRSVSCKGERGKVSRRGYSCVTIPSGHPSVSNLSASSHIEACVYELYLQVTTEINSLLKCMQILICMGIYFMLHGSVPVVIKWVLLNHLCPPRKGEAGKIVTEGPANKLFISCAWFSVGLMAAEKLLQNHSHLLQK